MELVNVLVNIPLSNELLQRITAISPRIRIHDISELVGAERRGDFSRKDELDAIYAKAEVIYGFGFSRDIITRAPILKWVQVVSAGVDRFMDDNVRESKVILTNSSGIMATPISEFVLQLMLMFVKKAPLCFQLKQEKQWQRLSTTVLLSKKVGIVGLGHIGREVARLAKAFGMSVIATRRSVKQVSKARNVDALLPSTYLPQLLSDSDFVVISLPLTSETNKLIGEDELRMMKSTAYLINISRGNIVDEKALVLALSENWIAGAGLDVFAVEPLPSNSKLWELDNVILSPHVSFGMEDLNVRTFELFCENLKRYLNGKRLINIVNKKRGY